MPTEALARDVDDVAGAEAAAGLRKKSDKSAKKGSLKNVKMAMPFLVARDDE